MKSQKTLLLQPALSVAQVGQLAIDLLIMNIKTMKRVGRINHDAILPMFGADPYQEDSEDVCTACDGLFESFCTVFIFQSCWLKRTLFIYEWSLFPSDYMIINETCYFCVFIEICLLIWG